MIIPFFDRPISESEILQLAKKMDIPPFEMLHTVTVQAEVTETQEIDEKEFKSFFAMLSRAQCTLHAMYQLNDVSMPLVSMYICRGNILGLVYNELGVKPVELLNPKDIGQVMSQCMRTFPECEAECRTKELHGPTVEEACEFLLTTDTATMSEDEKSMVDAMTNGARICFTISIGKNERTVHFLTRGNDGQYHSLVQRNENVALLTGPWLPALQEINVSFLKEYQKSVKQMMQSEE